MTTTTMTRQEAQGLRDARDHDVTNLTRKPKFELVAIYQSEGGFGGGTWSKDQLVGAIAEKRYPIARYNEAGHVLFHGPDLVNSACEFCACQYTWEDTSVLASGRAVLVQCSQGPGCTGDHK